MPQSSLLLVNKIQTAIPSGSLIVVDAGEARTYNNQVDSIEDVIGVAAPMLNTSGREWGPFYTGSECYNNDSIIWNDDLTFEIVDDNAVTNPGYEPFNPYAETDKYTVVLCQGFAAVLLGSPLPARWVLIATKTTHNWVLIR